MFIGLPQLISTFIVITLILSFFELIIRFQTVIIISDFNLLLVFKKKNHITTSTLLSFVSNFY